MRRIIISVLAVMWLLPGVVKAEEKEGGSGNIILNNKTLWRFRLVRETEELVKPDGEIVYGSVKNNFENSTRIHSWFKAHDGEPTLPTNRWWVKVVPEDKVNTVPSDTSPEWMKPDFNDGGWCRTRGPMMANFFSTDDGWKLILMRASFGVKDPSAAGDLKLSMDFRGGIVVYMNGKEVARKYMPKGEVNLSTPAVPYPKEADYLDSGYTLPWSRQTTRRELSQRPQFIKDRVASRTRKISDIKIPAGSLKEGANTLAIAIHRAPTPATRHVTRAKGGMSVNQDQWWTRLGLKSVELSATPGAAVEGNIGPGEGKAFQTWNHSIVQQVTVHDFPDPFESRNPIVINGARNGAFSGQIVLGNDSAIKNLKVSVSDLKGAGTIPSSAVRVRYGKPDGHKGTFDTLDDFVPDSVAVGGRYDRAVLPVWFTVDVPADAAAGEYSGTATIAADGIKPRKAGLRLIVSDWALPSTKEFVSHMDVVQSPETLAMAYDVPLWSDEHFALIDKSFELIGDMAGKTLYITCIRRTHFGNEHAMVRWVRDENFELKPDFTIVEKYLDTAVKHMGKVPGVILYCWEPPYSQGHAGGSGQAGKIHDKPILYTVYDPETGEYSDARGPSWGTQEAKEFWKKLTDGIQPVLEKRGLKDSMLFGLAGDHRPTKQAMDDISNGVPGAEWAIHSHYKCENWQGYDMGMFIALWGIKCGPTDPSRGRAFGWSNPQWMAYYPRQMGSRSTLSEYRCKLETWIGAYNGRWPKIATGYGPRGLGRLVGDFWKVLNGKHTLAGRYPESAWGQLNMNFWAPPLIKKGKKWPVASARSEMFRESAQQVEARVYLEKAWLDPEGPQILGKDLYDKCRSLVDERIRTVNISAKGGDANEAWFISSGWQDRATELFDLCGEVSKAYGNRQPNPNLSRRDKKKGE
ncbi:MAG: glycoside hydrolase domain-containing protein [Verrucomicrobiota bacterium]